MLALVREVSPQLAQCELTHLQRAVIDAGRAARQHREYTLALRSLGCALEWLPPLPECPDGVFVEDTAVVLPEIAVLTRPGAVSRRAETASVARALACHIRVSPIEQPGCLDGGDVLHIGRTLYVGASARSNAEAGEQLAPDMLLVNPAWIDPAKLGALRVITVDEREPYAANTLTVGGTTLVSAAYPETGRRLAAAGVRTQRVDVAELHKAEGALTCMSLLLG